MSPVNTDELELAPIVAWQQVLMPAGLQTRDPWVAY